MNNRKRARIRALKKECRAKLRRYRNYHAASMMLQFQYSDRMNRIWLGDGFRDATFKSFMNRSLGVSWGFKLIWKKTVRTRWIAPPSKLFDLRGFEPLPDSIKTGTNQSKTIYKNVAVGATWKIIDEADGDFEIPDMRGVFPNG